MSTKPNPTRTHEVCVVCHKCFYLWWPLPSAHSWFTKASLGIINTCTYTITERLVTRFIVVNWMAGKLLVTVIVVPFDVSVDQRFSFVSSVQVGQSSGCVCCYGHSTHPWDVDAPSTLVLLVRTIAAPCFILMTSHRVIIINRKWWKALHYYPMCNTNNIIHILSSESMQWKGFIKAHCSPTWS